MVEDLCHLPGQQVIGLEQLTCLLIHVDALLQEATCHDAQVPLGRLMDRECVIEKVEAENEEPVLVLRPRLGKPSSETENLALIVEEFDKVLFGWLWYQVDD